MFRVAADLTGERFGRLVAQRRGSNTLSGKATWECFCDCGNEVTCSAANLKKRGGTKSCGCIPREMSAARVKARRRPGKTAIGEIYGRYRRAAKIKSREFSLTKEEVEALVLGACHYCGNLPSRQAFTATKKQKYSIAVNGIDRKENSLGYTPENSVSCCAVCNWGKRGGSYSDFIAYLDQVVRHRGAGA